ncbi:MAG: BrnT family toxin [Pseudobdellovibrionaceae bacterium]
MKFEWDAKKAKTNLKKHGVSFEDAKEALSSEIVVALKEDSDSGEERYIYLGICKKLNVLVVVVAYPNEDITRIISARKANKRERKFYEAQL